MTEEVTTTQKTATADRLIGFIEDWSFHRGCGKLRQEGGAEVFFCHFKSVYPKVAIARGVKVSFEVSPIVEPGKKHRRAVNVTVIG